MGNIKDDEFMRDLIPAMYKNNLNANLRENQNKRLKAILGTCPEYMTIVLLKAMNIYSNLRNNLDIFYKITDDMINKAFNHIFSNDFLSQLSSYISDERLQTEHYKHINYVEEHVREFNDKEYVSEADILGLKTEDEVREYYTQLEPKDATNKIPDIFTICKDFFDLHFKRIDYNVNFILYYGLNSVSTIIADPFETFKSFKYNYIYSNNKNNPYNFLYSYKPVPITEDFYDFIDKIFSKISSVNMQEYNVQVYWINCRDKLKTYIENTDQVLILQYRYYKECLIVIGDTFFKWLYDGENFKIECPAEQTTLKYILKSNLSQFASFDVSKKCCLNIMIDFPSNKSKKPNKELIKSYLSYFTMNNMSVLDSLALDYVNLILNTNISAKNTVVYGDFDKFIHWYDFLMQGTPYQLKYITKHPYSTYYDFTNYDEAYIIDKIRINSQDIDFYRIRHKYFLVKGKIRNSNVNSISFPYGGEYYELEQLNDIDKLEIIKLLLVHGWHLLNNPSKKNKAKNVAKEKSKTKESYFNYFKNTDDHRIPIVLISEIFTRFKKYFPSDKIEKVTGTMMENLKFTYKNQQIRKEDRDYLNKLVEDAKDCNLELVISEREKMKAVSCELDPQFWDDMKQEMAETDKLAKMNEFEKYLRQLSEEYSEFFPEVPKPAKPKDKFKSLEQCTKIILNDQ